MSMSCHAEVSQQYRHGQIITTGCRKNHCTNILQAESMWKHKALRRLYNVVSAKRSVTDSYFNRQVYQVAWSVNQSKNVSENICILGP